MNLTRLIGEGRVTVRLQFCDVAWSPHLQEWMPAVWTGRIILTLQGKLTIKSSLQRGTLHLFANVTGGPGNSVH
jgi:hypothetical protein